MTTASFLDAIIGKAGRRAAALCVAFSLAVPAFAAERVVGANATLDMEPGARSAALGSATMAVDGDYLGLITNPYQLSNENYAWASFSHTEYYEDTRYDFASAVVPLGEGQGLGVSFSRFGADDIPYIREGEPLPEGSDYNTLSIADWVFSVTFGKRLTDRLELGFGFHGLYREIDQTGYGFRGDAGLRFRAVDELYLSALVKGWTSSAATWESGEFEYTAPEVYIAASYGLEVPYLYGKLNLYWQGAGLFRHEARDLDFEMDDSRGAPIWKDPLDWLSGGRGGIEFAFDFGLSIRAGLSSFTTFQSVTAGAGLTIAKFVKVDYAFESHPVFSPVHRVSISVSPYLFSHSPRPEPQRHRGKATGKGGLLGEEEPEEELVSEQNAPADGNAPSGASGEASGSGESVQEQPQSAAPAAPVVNETSAEPAKQPSGPAESDEVLERAPSGGIYWEE